MTPSDASYRETTCVNCGRLRVESNGICEKCGWDNDGGNFSSITRPVAEPKDYAEIPLTKGKKAKVSLHRTGDLTKLAWHARYSKNTKSWYAATMVGRGSERRSVMMARYILGLPIGDTRHADHINGDSLDNRDENLRIVDVCQNNANRREIFRNNTSGYKGVRWYRWTGKWVAYIGFRGQRYHLGYYNHAFQASEAYKAASAALHGKYGRANGDGSVYYPN